MADHPTAAAAETAAKPEQTSTSPAEVKAATDDAPADGVTAEIKGEATAEPSEAVKSNDDEPTKPEPTKSEPDAEDPASEKADNAETKDEVKTEVKNEGDAGEDTTAGVNGAASAPAKSNGKRKSTGGVPEHKSKKLNKKKSMAELNLWVKPGDYMWARMKGYTSWPVIICDEGMLPETLLNRRPVSAMRPDGTYREDFADGGKNVRDRRYPVMFLGTNEFAWQVNTEMSKLDMEELKQAVANGEQGKKTKTLWDAWKVTAENRDLAYYKNMLMDHEKAIAQDAEERAAKEAEKAAKEAEKAERAEKASKATKKEKRKSKAGAADEDVIMDDAAETETPAKKASKKRKKEADSEIDTPNPAKTPKTKLKVNGPKTPAETSTPKTKKPSAAKAKASKKADSGSETPKVEEVLTPAQLHDKRSKGILYLRHRLQKGFLTREQVPKEEEMQQMSEWFTQLEGYRDLEVSIIRETKIYKVLKAIIKLDSIPKDEVYNFKQRSSELLAVWNKSMSEAAAAGSEAPAKTNGVESKDETKEAAKDEEEDSEKATPAAEPAKDSDAVGEDKAKVDDAPKDVEMKDAEDASAAAPAEAESKEGEKSDVAMEDAKPAEAAAEATEDEAKPTEEVTAAA